MAANNEKTERQGVSHDKCEAARRVVLVGTYRGDQLKNWRGWYSSISEDEFHAEAQRRREEKQTDLLTPNGVCDMNGRVSRRVAAREDTLPPVCAPVSMRSDGALAVVTQSPADYSCITSFKEAA